MMLKSSIVIDFNGNHTYLSNKIGLICKVGSTKSGSGTFKNVNRVRKI